MAIVSPPNFSCPSSFVVSSFICYDHSLGLLSSKLALPFSIPGHDVTKLSVGDFNHIRSLVSDVSVGESAVISVDRYHRETLESECSAIGSLGLTHVKQIPRPGM